MINPYFYNLQVRVLSTHKITGRLAPEKINKFECAFAYKRYLREYAKADSNIFVDVS